MEYAVGTIDSVEFTKQRPSARLKIGLRPSASFKVDSKNSNSSKAEFSRGKELNSSEVKLEPQILERPDVLYGAEE